MSEIEHEIIFTTVPKLKPPVSVQYRVKKEKS